MTGRRRLNTAGGRVDVTGMRPLARDDEQVRYWVRHTRTGMLMCLGLPVLLAGYAWLVPWHPHAVAITALAAAVSLTSPLLLLVPVERLVRHPRGGWFFYLWEAGGVALVAAFALLDAGAQSPYVAVFYVLLAHAALAYPPAGMAVTGLGIIGAYLTLAAVAGSPGTGELLFVVLTLAVAAANCAFASYNHVRAYRRTADYAAQIAVLAERGRADRLPEPPDVPPATAGGVRGCRRRPPAGTPARRRGRVQAGGRHPRAPRRGRGARQGRRCPAAAVAPVGRARPTRR